MNLVLPLFFPLRFIISAILLLRLACHLPIPFPLLCSRFSLARPLSSFPSSFRPSPSCPLISFFFLFFPLSARCVAQWPCVLIVRAHDDDRCARGLQSLPFPPPSSLLLSAQFRPLCISAAPLPLFVSACRDRGRFVLVHFFSLRFLHIHVDSFYLSSRGGWTVQWWKFAKACQDFAKIAVNSKNQFGLTQNTVPPLMQLNWPLRRTTVNCRVN